MPAIRRQINIAAPPRAVWNVLTTGEGLTKWLASSARIDAREGGRVVLAAGAAGEEKESRGLVHTWRPTSHLEISFDRVGDSELRGSHVAFKLARDGDETRLNLVHSGGEALDDEARRGALDRVWAGALDKLQTLLDAP